MTNMQLQWSRLTEDHRHSLEQERQGRVELAERIRHQVAQDTETMRHDRYTEAEINRHNLVTEQLMVSEQRLKQYQIELQNAIEEKKLLNAREIADMQNETSKMLGLLKQRATDVKTKAELEKWTTELDQAQEKLDQDLKESDSRIEVNNAKAYGSLEGIMGNLLKGTKAAINSMSLTQKEVVISKVKSGAEGAVIKALKKIGAIDSSNNSHSSVHR